MKITGVKPILCNGGIRNWVFVKVATDEGITGVGDASGCWPGEPGVVSTIEYLASYVVGEDPFNIEKLWQKMYFGSYFVGLGGIVNSAITGIETALWDIVGKALQTPVYNLLGGRCRDKVKLYTHCDAWGGGEFEQKDTREALKKQVRIILDQGFTAFKTHLSNIGRWRRDVESLNRQLDRETIRNTVTKLEILRGAAGEDIEICIDVNGLLNAMSAIRLGKALEKFDLVFYEEPVPPENIAAMKEVKDAIRVPICTGERLYTTYGFREILEMNAVDIIMPDITKCGGLSQAKKIAAMAENHYVTVAPHNYNSRLCAIISAHLCASIPNFLMLEFPWPDVPWADKVISPPPKVENGYLELPTGPGFGVDLVDEEIAKHPYKKTGRLLTDVE